MTDINDVHETLNKRIERARNNQRLSEQARQAEIAAAFVQAKRQADALLAQQQQRIESERQRLTRKLVGNDGKPATGADAVSRRDAADRAATIKNPDEALRMIRLAHDSGDTHLAQAVTRHSLTQAATLQLEGGPWLKVVEEFAREQPGATDTLKALQDLPTSGQAKFRMSAHYVVPMPNELGRLGHAQIEQLAESPLAGDDA